MTQTIIKQIPNFPNYQISSNSEIFNIKKDKIIKQTFCENGYYSVTLFKYLEGKRIKKKFYVHRLLGLCFLENPDNKPIIDHINRIKTDNKLSNLRFASFSENALNASVRKNKKSGLFKNICDYGSRYRTMIIKNGTRVFDKSYLKKNYCLEQVRGERNQFLTANYIPIVD